MLPHRILKKFNLNPLFRMTKTQQNVFPSGMAKKFTSDPSIVLPKFTETTTEELDQIYSRLSHSFSQGKTKPLEFRKQQLSSLYSGIIKESPLLVEALHRDFKSVGDSFIEVQSVLQQITDFIENLDEWTASEEVSKPISIMADSAKVIKEPLGLQLSISPWNFPFILSMEPFLGAMASGNCCVLKPSEHSVNASAMVAYLVNKYTDSDCYAVVNGEKEITTMALEKKWDFIAYTGNGTIARIVMAAAAKHLTPTLLELGGKSPAIIDDETCDLRIAARRIIWSKCLNAGQICIAADYVICRPHVKEKLIEIMKEELTSFFANQTRDNPEYTKIVNKNHCERISKLIPTADSPASHGKVVYGGNFSIKDRYIEPTIVTDLDPNVAPLMKEEIFGPVLPIIVLEDIENTIHFMKSRDKPLALYIFSEDYSLVDRLISEISSGGVCVNDTIMHFNISTLPFGGVGESGTGSYHGRHSIDQFSHKRAVYSAFSYRKSEKSMALRYPGSGDMSQLIPIMFKHNLYPSPPTDKYLPKLYNHIVAFFRLSASLIGLLMGGSGSKKTD